MTYNLEKFLKGLEELQIELSDIRYSSLSDIMSAGGKK